MSADTYRYHLGVNTKLVRGRSPDGPIRPGSEARLNAHNADFPKEMEILTRVDTFFPERPPITKVDALLAPGGAFVCLPVFWAGKHLSLFSRIEARSEKGTGKGGRRFTHCAVLIVEDKWEPALIPWAAQRLFLTSQDDDRCWGDPVPEHLENRTDLVLPTLSRRDLEEFVGYQGTPADQSREVQGHGIRVRFPEIEDNGLHPQCEIADEIADSMIRNNFSVQGRWLSIASGISADIAGVGSGYFIRYDTRDEAAEERAVTVDFDDSHPPLVNVPDFDRHKVVVPDWPRLSPPGQGVIRSNSLRAENFWPDQQDRALFDGPAQIGATAEQSSSFMENFAREAARDLQAQSPEPQDTLARSPVHDTAHTPNHQYSVEETVAETLNETEAPFADYANDPVDWPVFYNPDLLGEDDRQITTRESLDYIEACFWQFHTRLSLIDPPNFPLYPKSRKSPEWTYKGKDASDPDPVDRAIIGSFRYLTELIARFAVGGNPNALKEDLQRVLSHPPLPNIGYQTAMGRNGLFGFLLSRYCFDEIGEERLMNWVEDKAAAERKTIANMRDYDRSMGRSTGRVTYVPKREHIAELIAWLKEEPFEIPDFKAYKDANEEWWFNAGIQDLFFELSASLKEIFD